MILFCILVSVYVYKICEEEFGGCRKSFSWLGQKVNKKIDVYGHNADDSSSDLNSWPWMTLHPGKTSQHRSIF